MSTDKRTNCTHTQKLIAKQAGEYILMHMDKRITINEMAGLMHVSETQLKNSFRNYYGNSVYKFIRARKMQEAAVLLAEGRLSVMEIAGMLGYENCSKFSAAFRGEYGMSPSDYRRLHRVGF